MIRNVAIKRLINKKFNKLNPKQTGDTVSETAM